MNDRGKISEACLVFFRGRFVENDEVRIDFEDRGYQFGDGIYEVVRVYNGRCFLLERHLDRFEKSAAALRLKIPTERSELSKKLQELVERNEVGTGLVYFQLTRGSAQRGHAIPDGSEPCLLAYTDLVERPTGAFEKGIRAIMVKDIRWLRCDIKSLNLLGNVLARQEAVDAGVEEAIQHRDGMVTEGSASNVFAVRGGVLYTHPVSTLILAGVSRRRVLDLARRIQLETAEVTFSVQELKEASEVFVTGTTAEVTPVIEIDGKAVGDGVPGKWTRLLQNAFFAEVDSLCGNGDTNN